MHTLTSLITFFIGILRLESAFHGDEEYGNLKGVFYVFAANGIYSLDPFSQNIDKIIDYGSTSFGDSVYIRNQAQTKHFVYSSDTASNKMLVINSDTKMLLATPKTAVRDIHIYAVTLTEEVWAHSDGTGTFDVFNLNVPEYRINSLVPSKVLKGGHGKLSINYKSLGSKALTSNVVEPYFAIVDLQSKKQVEYIQLPCSGSHGIGSSDISGHYYVQCIGVNATMYEVDPITKTVVKKFTSAYLNQKNNALNSGLLGQLYLSPEESFFIVPNPAANVIAVLKPTPTGTQVLEIPVSYNPGATIYYPKNTSLPFGSDQNPSNYWAVINLEEKSASGGVAFIDMAVIVDGFKRNVTILDPSVVTYLATGPGKGDRPIARGNDFVVIPVLTGTTTADTTFGSIALVNIKTKTLVSTFTIPGVSRTLWVPIHKDEIRNTITSLQTQVSALTTASPNSNSNNCNCDNTKTNQAMIIGSVGLITGFVALILSLLWVCSSKKSDNHQLIQSKDGDLLTSVA